MNTRVEVTSTMIPASKIPQPTRKALPCKLPITKRTREDPQAARRIGITAGAVITVTETDGSEMPFPSDTMERRRKNLWFRDEPWRTDRDAFEVRPRITSALGQGIALACSLNF